MIINRPQEEETVEETQDPVSDVLNSAHKIGGKPAEDVMAARMLMNGQNTEAARHTAALGGQDQEAAAALGQMLDQQQQQQAV